jgi:hypothetical protein
LLNHLTVTHACQLLFDSSDPVDGAVAPPPAAAAANMAELWGRSGAVSMLAFSAIETTLSGGVRSQQFFFLEDISL